MILYNAVMLLLIFRGVKSDVLGDAKCKDVYNDITNIRTILDITEYCNNKVCVVKCCGFNEVLNGYGQCMKTKSRKDLHSRIIYAIKELHSWDGTEDISQKIFTDIVLVQNERFRNNKCFYEYPPDKNISILRDGSVKLERDNILEPWIDIDKLTFCLEYRVIPVTINNVTNANITLILRESVSIEEIVVKSRFTVIATLISCFFMVLVLVVYGSLRQLRNITGLMLMAYVSSLLVTYVLKVVMELAIGHLHGAICKKLAPVFYFAALSSSFWLNIMSFDVWWTLRGHRICRDIHRKGELVKFLWYCLYGWGTPLLLTAIATVLDNVDLKNSPFIIKPAFHQCFRNDKVWNVYINRPVGVIIAINIIFFVMTIYNIWLIKRGVNDNQESRNSKKDTNRFSGYLKLAVIMGVGWSLEQIPDANISLVWYILINFNNMLVGVLIFFLFVFKKKIFMMICNRFDVKNEYVQNLQLSHSVRNPNRTTSSRATKTSQPQTQESNV